ncbi:MAG: hypothetical protein JST59_06380 [Actinobacteria bacterium]|nr:hypothetical protein [Actinomycetota bacterium]
MRKLFVAFLGAIAVLAALAPNALAVPEGTVILKFYDQHGNGTELTPAQAKTVMHGEGYGAEGWDTDALLNPTTLQDVYEYPLYSSSGKLRFDIPSEAVAFAVSWPTDSEGYSYVIVDNGGKGFTKGETIVFNYVAAKDEMRRLNEALAARSTYVKSKAFETAYAEASSNLKTAEAASTDAERGKYGQRALDGVSLAYQLLLTEYGPKYAHEHATENWAGLTVDDPSVYAEWPSLASKITEPGGWVRIVFDPTKDKGKPEYYKGTVEAAEKAGLKIVGQPVDSAFASKYTRAEYLERFKAFVNAYPNIQAWEVGNEVNGCWVDSKTTESGSCTSTLIAENNRIKNKIADAAAYVREKRPTAKVVLTLYWQMGGDAKKWSPFNWARTNLSAAVRKNIDVVLLSQYVEDAPMGMAFDQVMNEMHAEFPEQEIGLGELDYWSTDTSKVFWAFNRESTLAARRKVAANYYAEAAGYPFSIMGGFWWYFTEEMPGDSELQAAVRGVVEAIH